MARGIFVVGNWKMYKTAREASDYIEELGPKLTGISARVYLAVPFTSIATAHRSAQGTPIVVGAQNMNDARDGAFTGEIAALMLVEAGAEFVILGHSERRRAFGESDSFIHQKVVRALKDGLQPILCVGEDLHERKAGKMEEILNEQLTKCLGSIPSEEAKKILIAYEPVWAIGAGEGAGPDVAQEAHAYCRKCLAELFDPETADEIPILYGGAVKSDTVASLMRQADIDGVLVGRASLDPKMFSEIILNCENVK